MLSERVRKLKAPSAEYNIEIAQTLGYANHNFTGNIIAAVSLFPNQNEMPEYIPSDPIKCVVLALKIRGL